jgi:acyl dehydratase
MSQDGRYRGVVTFEQQVLNTKDEVLLRYTVKRMIRRKPQADR